MAFNDELKNGQEQPIDEVAEVANEPETEEVLVEEATKTKTTKSSKKAKKPSKIKSAFGELKKVTWPSFGSVVKRTATVLSFTLVFLVVIMGIDQLLYFLQKLITKTV